MTKNNNNAVVTYPVRITREEEPGNNWFVITAIDFDGAMTCAEVSDFSDAIEHARQLIAIVLFGYDDVNRQYPEPSNIDAEDIYDIEVDLDYYRSITVEAEDL